MGGFDRWVKCVSHSGERLGFGMTAEENWRGTDQEKVKDCQVVPSIEMRN